MTTFKAGDFVWVPFPFVEEARLVFRPALVLTTRPLGPLARLGWVAMVTNVLRPSWPGDVPIENWNEAGLKIPSKVRTEKISTLDLSEAEKVGVASPQLLAAVQLCIRSYLA